MVQTPHVMRPRACPLTNTSAHGTTSPMKTKVIFRVWPKHEGGEPIAIFPQLPGNGSSQTCLSYMHTGQHSACDIHGLTRTLRLATPTEYSPLAKELRRLGYRLDIRKRHTQRDCELRNAPMEVKVGPDGQTSIPGKTH